MNEAFRELDRFLEDYLEKHQLPGFTVAVRGPQGELFSKGYGFADPEKQRPMGADTVCGVASMSKSMTALAAAILESEGKLSYEDPVQKYIPGFRVPGIPGELVQVVHLARHTAGIPPFPGLGWSLAFHNQEEPWWKEEMESRRAGAYNRMATVEDIVDYIANRVKPLGAPGEYMSYSNDCYALLSTVVDVAAGQSLEEFLRERIFIPLGMDRTVLDLDGREADRMAGGDRTELFAKDGDGTLRCTHHWDVAPPYRGCHGVKSTARDMARYYQMLSRGGVFENRQVVPADAVERMAGRQYPQLEEGTYCLGLAKRYYRGHVICEHSGGLTGISSQGGYLQGEGISAVVLCNLEEAPVSAIQNAMYNRMLGFPLEQSHTWLSPQEGPEDPGFYQGDYDSSEGPNSKPVQVRLRDGRLWAKTGYLGWPDTEQELAYCGGSRFMGLAEGQDFDQGTVHQFLVRGGRPWAVRIGTRICVRMEEEQEENRRMAAMGEWK